MKRFYREIILSRFLYSLPVQLLLYNIKRNHVLLLLWFLILAIITENLGTTIGLPSLFLEPEYLNKVDFRSFFLMGFTLGIFMMSYHIVSYILDGPQFAFIGSLRRPFTKFFINNNTVPTLVILVYIYSVLINQFDYEHFKWIDVLSRCFGLILGTSLSSMLIFLYFISTNQDIVKVLASSVDKRLKKTKMVRVNVMGRLKTTRRKSARIDYYLVNPFRLKRLDQESWFDNQAILKVFDQNHLNAVIIQLTILALFLLMGTLRDYPEFQLPAGASILLFFTILLMVAGSLSYWLRGWSTTFALIFLLVLNYLMQEKVLVADYKAYGLDYKAQAATYSLYEVKENSKDTYYQEDRTLTQVALDNWKKKHQAQYPGKKPKMVFICTSGGGLRAAMWAMHTLQVVDSTLQGKLMDHTMLFTGASGGLLGAAYFRELYLRHELYLRGESPNDVNPYDKRYLSNMGRDNLNALAFSLVVNDLFFGFQNFNYAGQTYAKDRGYAFEQQLNLNTEGVLDKALCEYREPELLSLVPMMIVAPTIVNDGRKLFISPLNVSYMTVPRIDLPRFLNQKTKGIEFLRFFERQNARNLRFLSALRMNATFPYVTPNVKLPSQPAMEIMDAGLSDNFGISDAVRFLYTFKDWIKENTSGVIFVSIRDTQKDKPIEKSLGQSLFQRIFTPLASLYGNLEYLQDISNDNMVEFAQSWFGPNLPIYRIEFQYVPVSENLKTIYNKDRKRFLEKPEGKKPPKILTIKRAALSWRLTEKEKASILRTIYEFRNRYYIENLRRLLEND